MIRDEIIFAASATIWIVLLHLLYLYKIGSKRSVAFVCALFQLLFVNFSSGILLIYYFATGALLSITSIAAIYQTNYLEAIDFLQSIMSPGYYIGLLGIEIVMFGLFSYLNRQIKFKGIGMTNNKLGITLIISFLLLSIYNGFYLNHSYMLRTIIGSKTYFTDLENFKQMRDDRESFAKHVMLHTNDINGSKNTYMLVIGESQNKLHMSSYGYQRQTTPRLDDMVSKNEVILFENVYSCHTHTIPALTFALTEASQYNGKKYQDAVSLLEVAKASGFKITWISNQVRYGAWDMPISVIANSADEQIWINDNVGETTDTKFHDGKIIETMQEMNNNNNNNLIIIHLIGNHSLYKKRFPEEFNKFTDMTLLSQEDYGGNVDKVNSYDNSILYNDYVVSELLKLGREKFNVSAFIYFSDHAEELVKGFSHNADKFDFEMTRIPMYMYFSTEYLAKYPHLVNTLQDHKQSFFTNDMIYDTVLGVMRIKTDYYNANQDLSSVEYNFKKEDLKTLHGARKIGDDPFLLNN
jgi:heptose-I-phosphate ethanolaminephosphotransferase